MANVAGKPQPNLVASLAAASAMQRLLEYLC